MGRREDERERLMSYDSFLPEKDHFKTHGVLLSNEITYYALQHKMIDPFDKESLKPAAYELRLGWEYSIGGEIKELSDALGKNSLVIPPFEVVIISTMETINLPRFIIARWNVRVRKAYEGLLWVGGPQVDPGWVGPLRCPIYNLSNKDVTLELGEQIAVIDFVKTTPYVKECVNNQYDRPPKRVLFDDYNPEKLQSALQTEAARRIKKLEEDIEYRVEKIERRVGVVTSLIGAVFTCIAILFAALSIFVSSLRNGNLQYFPTQFYIWVGISIAISIIAMYISLHRPIPLILIDRKWLKSVFSITFVINIIMTGVLSYLAFKAVQSGIIRW